MVLPGSLRIPRVPSYSGLQPLQERFTLTGLLPSLVKSFHSLFCLCSLQLCCSAPRKRRNVFGLGWHLFDRLYLGVHFCFLFLRLLRCFSSPGSLHVRGDRITPIGLPHSDILGSRVICTSPRLFAACHVLRRLLKPRHPPSALLYFLVFCLYFSISNS